MKNKLKKHVVKILTMIICMVTIVSALVIVPAADLDINGDTSKPIFRITANIENSNDPITYPQSLIDQQIIYGNALTGKVVVNGFFRRYLTANKFGNYALSASTDTAPPSGLTYISPSNHTDKLYDKAGTIYFESNNWAYVQPTEGSLLPKFFTWESRGILDIDLIPTLLRNGDASGIGSGWQKREIPITITDAQYFDFELANYPNVGYIDVYPNGTSYEHRGDTNEKVYLEQGHTYYYLTKNDGEQAQLRTGNKEVFDVSFARGSNIESFSCDINLARTLQGNLSRLVLLCETNRFNLLMPIVNDAYENGWMQGDSEGQIQGYNAGFTNGYNDGYEVGYTDGNGDGYSLGYDEGEAYGWANGFGAGQNDMAETSHTFKEMVFAIFDAPSRLIDSMLNFDIFGINLAGLVKTIITLAVVAVILVILLKWLL